MPGPPRVLCQLHRRRSRPGRSGSPTSSKPPATRSCCKPGTSARAELHPADASGPPARPPGRSRCCPRHTSARRTPATSGPPRSSATQPGRDRLLPVRIEPCDLHRCSPPGSYIDLVGLDEVAAAAGCWTGSTGPCQAARHAPVPRPAPARTAGKSRFPGSWPAILNAPATQPELHRPRRPAQELRRPLRTPAGRRGGAGQRGLRAGWGGQDPARGRVRPPVRRRLRPDLVDPRRAAGAIPGHLAGLARRLGPARAGRRDASSSRAVRGAAAAGPLAAGVRQRHRPRRTWRRYRPPAGGGHLLVTSRNPAWGGMATPLPVEVLPAGRGGGVAARPHRPPATTAAEALAAALGDLPLALEQAGAYVEQTRDCSGRLPRAVPGAGWGVARAGHASSTTSTPWPPPGRWPSTGSAARRQRRRSCCGCARSWPLRTCLAPYSGNRPSSSPTGCNRPPANSLAFNQAVGALGRYSLVDGERAQPWRCTDWSRPSSVRG